MRFTRKVRRFLSPTKTKPRRPGLPLRAAVVAALVPAALLGSFALLPSAAMAEAEPCVNNVLCDNAGEALRDDAAGPGNFGTDAMATNSEGALALTAKETPVGDLTNSNPMNYAYFGVELERNPETSGTACEEATGSVTFADIQNTAPSAVFAGISPGGFGAWPISVRSDQCATDPGKVEVGNVHLLFPQLLEAVASGTFTGQYLQPGEEDAFGDSCEAGGLDLDQPQPGVTVEVLGEKFETGVSNGEGEDALLCFVSANNYLFPEADSEGNGPSWEPLEGAIWKD